MSNPTFHKTRPVTYRGAEVRAAAWEARKQGLVIATYDGNQFNQLKHAKIYGKPVVVFGYQDWRALVLLAHEKVELDKLAEEAAARTEQPNKFEWQSGELTEERHTARCLVCGGIAPVSVKPHTIKHKEGCSEEERPAVRCSVCRGVMGSIKDWQRHRAECGHKAKFQTLAEIDADLAESWTPEERGEHDRMWDR